MRAKPTGSGDPGYDVTLAASGDRRVDVDAPDLLTPHTLVSAEHDRDDMAATIATATTPSRTLPPRADGSVAGRYAERNLLGAGGMGEVRLVRDHVIGREVAMKVVRRGSGSSGGSQQRFLREARVQGQLEHPSIVPVYDLGVDPEGAPWFTMKRVRGVSLAEVIDGLADGDPDLQRRSSRRKLLTAFTNVCLTVHFAHAHGVLHRDLKPANIMLGDFGEVYVLDWGLAKIKGTEDERDAGVTDGGDGAETVAGEVMGTPGYMSPEQLRGKPLDARSDVYALGAILHEILTLERANVATSFQGIVCATLEDDPIGPARRAPDRDVPPELDAICVRALARKPEERFADARELSDAIERYLDGDRDLELRRNMAEDHARAARAALSVERGRAMREVTTALGLDATNRDALATLVELLTKPPRDVPPEARRMMKDSARAAQKVAGRAAVLVYLGFALYLPFPFWMGVKSTFAFGAVGVTIALCAAVAWMFSRRPPEHGKVPLGMLALSSLAVMAAAAMLGPFVIVPTLAMANSMAYLSIFGRERRVFVIGASALAMAMPAALQWAGVWPASYAFSHDTLVVLPQMMHFPAVPTSVFLLVANAMLIVTGALFVARLRDAYTDAEKRLHLQAWQLRQIVPETARDLVE